jgi:hypothetical protein
MAVTFSESQRARLTDHGEDALNYLLNQQPSLTQHLMAMGGPESVLATAERRAETFQQMVEAGLQVGGLQRHELEEMYQDYLYPAPNEDKEKPELTGDPDWFAAQPLGPRATMFPSRP